MTDPTRDPNHRWYIDRRDTSLTRDEVRLDAERGVDRDIEQAGWFRELVLRWTRGSEIDQRFSQQLAAQASDLAAGVDMRTPPAMQCTNYLSYPHAQLKPMVTQDVSPEDVGAMSDLYTQAGNAMVKFQNDVAAAITSSQTQWEGRAGDAARKFMADTGNWVGRAGQSAQYAGTQLALHSAALAEAKNSMPDEVPFDYGAAMQDLRTTTDPLSFAAKAMGYQRDYQASQAAHEAAARVVGAYDSRLGAAAVMPAFAAPPTMAGDSGQDAVQEYDARTVDQPRDTDVSVKDPGRTEPRSDADTRQQQPRDTYTPPTPPDRPDGDRGGDPTVPPPRTPNQPPPMPGDNGATTPGGYDPAIPAAPGQITGPTPTTAGPHAGAVPVGGLPPMGLGGDGVRGGLGGRSGIPSGGGAGTGGTGRPPGVGFGAGALAAEQAAARGVGAAAGRAGAGMAGMGAPPQARGQGAEDEEHERPSYLLEPDPDEVFGAGETTAPPVIGG
ncbi:hypothetical protein [Actinokineospora sp. NPDC004072]